jgi:uncharacterized lipoprotein YddW (UPF0748 family)
MSTSHLPAADFCPDPVDTRNQTDRTLSWISRRKFVTGMAGGALVGRLGWSSTRSAGKPEGRALWVNRFEYASAQDIARIVERAGKANFNVLYFQVRGQGDAYYRSKVEPCAVALCGQLGGDPPYDPLEVAITEARKYGIEIHAWLNALSAWPSRTADICALLDQDESAKPRHLLLEHPDWVMVDDQGVPTTCPNNDEYVYWSPAWQGVRSQLARVTKDLARNYEIKGIHLDRLRYPGKAWSYDQASLEGFGRDPAQFPAEWDQFRRDQVNLTAKAAFRAMVAIDPRLTMSAAVWAIYQDVFGWNATNAYETYFQDARAWARDGYLDVAAPMTYEPMTEQYCDRVDWACLLPDHIEGIQKATGRHVYIGMYAENGADEMLRAIDMAREQGAAGISMYSYKLVDQAGLWDKLATGPLKDRVEIPEQPWKKARTVPGDGTEGPRGTPIPDASPSPVGTPEPAGTPTPVIKG